MRVMRDLILVVVLEGLGKARRQGARIEHVQAGAQAAALDHAADHQGAFVRRRLAAIGRRRNRHDQITAAETFQFHLQRRELAARRPCAEKVLAHMGDGARVVAEPGAVIVADACRQHQPVVVQRAARGVDAAALAVDAADLCPDEGIAVGLRGGSEIVREQRAVDAPVQPLIGQRHGEEGGVPLDQHDLQFRRQIAQMARCRQSAPAAADHDNAAASCGRQERRRLLCKQRGGAGCERGGKKAAAWERHPLKFSRESPLSR